MTPGETTAADALAHSHHCEHMHHWRIHALMGAAIMLLVISCVQLNERATVAGEKLTACQRPAGDASLTCLHYRAIGQAHKCVGV